MDRVRILSFDLEGTLVDTVFSQLVWEVGLPDLYAEEMGIDHEAAVKKVMQEYSEIGPERIEWYDLKYWFKRFQLQTEWRRLLERYKGNISIYPEVKDVLEHLSKEYELILISNTSREFMAVMTEELSNYFAHTFSGPTDFKMLKFQKLYTKIVEQLGAKPQDIVHIGDHEKFDLAAARQAGIQAFLLDRTGERCGDYIVRDLKAFEIKLYESS